MRPQPRHPPGSQESIRSLPSRCSPANVARALAKETNVLVGCDPYVDERLIRKERLCGNPPLLRQRAIVEPWAPAARLARPFDALSRQAATRVLRHGRTPQCPRAARRSASTVPALGARPRVQKGVGGYRDRDAHARTGPGGRRIDCGAGRSTPTIHVCGAPCSTRCPQRQCSRRRPRPCWPSTPRLTRHSRSTLSARMYATSSSIWVLSK
jgi:hypothetical protein